MMDFMAKIGLDSSALTRGMAQVKAKAAEAGAAAQGAGASAAKGISGQVAGMFAVGAIAAGARAIVDYGGKVTDLADRFSVSTDTVQALDYAAQQTGTSVETALGAIRKVAIATSDALGGNTDKLQAFERLGVTAEQLKTLSPEEIFNKLANNLKDMPMTAQVFSDINDTLGKAGQELMPMFQQGLEGMTTRARELGLIIDEETISKLDEMGDTMGEAGMRLKSAFAPVITFVMDGINHMLRGFEMISEFMANRLTRVFDIFNKVIDGDFKGAAKAFGGVFTGVGEDINRTLDFAVKRDELDDSKAADRKGQNERRRRNMKGGGFAEDDKAEKKAADKAERDAAREAEKAAKLHEQIWEKQVKAMPIDKQIEEYKKKLESLKAAHAAVVADADGGADSSAALELKKDELDMIAKIKALGEEKAKGVAVKDTTKLDSLQLIGGSRGPAALAQNAQQQLKTLEDILGAMKEGNSNTSVLHPSK